MSPKKKIAAAGTIEGLITFTNYCILILLVSMDLSQVMLSLLKSFFMFGQPL